MQAQDNILHPSTDSFDQDVLQRKGAVLVDFWAPWCGPCRAVKPSVEALGEERPELGVAFINIDEHPELASRFQVSSIPSLHLYVDGERVDQKLGAHSKPALAAWVDSHA